MSIFRTPKAPKPSTPPQNNIERGDDIPIIAVPTPEILAAPVISGNLKSGSVLLASPATWKNPMTISISRGWFRDGVGIPNASNLNYLTVLADVDHDITYRETATNNSGSLTVSSNILRIVTADVLGPPTPQSQPSWSTYAWKVGHEITAVAGTFVGATEVVNRWTRNGVDIPGVTGLKYTPVIADIGTTLRFISRGINSAGAHEQTTGGQVIGPSDVTEPPNDKFYDFTLASTVPSGVTVSRSGDIATHVNQNLTLVSDLANTPRIQHNASAVPEGLYIEKERTNLVAYGRTPGLGTGWEVLGSASVVSTTEPDVMGGNLASRITIPPGSGYSGIRYTLNNTSDKPLYISYYAKSNTGSDADMRGSPHGDVIAPRWAKYEKIVAAQSAFKLDFVSAGSAAIDITMCIVGVYNGGQINESMIPTNGVVGTRSKEMVTFTGPTNYFYDIRVRFVDNSVQDFINQIVNGDWTLDADVLNTGPNKSIIKTVGFYSVGGLPSNEVPPPPPPSNNPIDLGRISNHGDSLTKGDVPLFYSYVLKLDQLLTSGNYAHQWVGTNEVYWLTSPGNLPCSARGGWTVQNLIDDIPKVVAINPQTLVISYGTNDPDLAVTKTTEYLNALHTALGAGRRYFICAPVKLWWTQTVQNNIVSAMQAWCAASPTNRHFIDLNEAGLTGVGPGGDFSNLTPDNTHWTEQGANKIGTLIYNKIKAVFGTATSTPPPSSPPPPPPPTPGGGLSFAPADDPSWLNITRTAGGWIGPTQNSGYQYSASSSRYEGNEALMEGIGYINSGFRNGPAHGFGNIWRRSPEQPNGHIPAMLANGSYTESTFSNYCDPWMVFCHEQGFSNGIGWIEVAKLSLQVRLKSTGIWYWIFHWHPSSPVYRSSRIGWAPNWIVGPGYSQGYDPQGGDRPTPLWDSQNQIAKVSIKAGTIGMASGIAGYACHFTFADAQFQYVNAADVDCFLLSAQVRRGSSSESGHKGLVHLGMDPKFRSAPPGGGEVWPYGVFPPSSISQTIRLTDQWRPIHCGGITATELGNVRLKSLSYVNQNRPMQPF